MDYHVTYDSSMALFIAFLAFVITSIQIYKKKINSSRNLPPGPWRLPIVGNMHQMINSIPHRCLADLAKKHGPVMYLKLGEIANIVVSSRQAAEEVLKTNDVMFAQRPVLLTATILTYNYRNISFAPYGAYWRQVRKICVVHLTSTKQVESFKPVREAEVAMLVKSIMDSPSGGFPVNLSNMIRSLTTSIISKATFGDSCKRVDAFAPLVNRMSEISAGFSIADFFPSVGVLHNVSGVKDKVMKLHKEVDDVLEGVISEYKESKEARKNNSNDVLGVLLDLQDQCNPEDSLSTESIKAILLDLFSAGIETSATTLEWTISELLRHPKVMEKVQSEVRHAFKKKTSIAEADLHDLKYMEAVIKETFRLHPPFPLILPREAKERVTINGYEVPAKTRVLVNAWAIGRDPEIWTDAETFYPERFLEASIDYMGNHLEFIPFGAGRRICPGIGFGMSIVELTLASLLCHFNWEIPDGVKPECLDMSEASGIAVRRKHDLCLIATPYHQP